MGNIPEEESIPDGDMSDISNGNHAGGVMRPENIGNMRELVRKQTHDKVLTITFCVADFVIANELIESLKRLHDKIKATESIFSDGGKNFKLSWNQIKSFYEQIINSVEFKDYMNLLIQRSSKKIRGQFTADDHITIPEGDIVMENFEEVFKFFVDRKNQTIRNIKIGLSDTGIVDEFEFLADSTEFESLLQSIRAFHPVNKYLPK